MNSSWDPRRSFSSPSYSSVGTTLLTNHDERLGRENLLNVNQSYQSPSAEMAPGTFMSVHSPQTSMSHPSSPFMPQQQPSLQSRFLMAVNQPIIQRCIEVTQLIQEGIQTSSRELAYCFLIIVDGAFDLGSISSPGVDWGIKTVSRSFQILEYDHLMSFFSTTGPVFQLMKFLSNEPTFRCDFPINRLPMPLRQRLEEGLPAGFYANKMLLNSTVLQLKPLEYFLFAFCRFIHCEYNFGHIITDAQRDVTTVLISLLESYLSYFCPLTSNPPSAQNQATSSASASTSIWNSLSSTTSNLLHLNRSGVMQSPPTASIPIRSSLINVKHLQNTFNTTSEFPEDTDVFGNQKFKCDLFLTIFSDVLLNTAPSKGTKPRMSPILSNRQPQPATEHLRAVRVFIKHLHSFANSCPSNDAASDPQFKLTSPLDDIKRSVWSVEKGLQKRVYLFLKLCFEVWPSDSSFRLPVETWLSYIQPWRYGPQSNNRDDNDEDRRDAPSVSRDWLPFIVRNLPFYNSMFVQVMERLTRFDLMSSKNSIIIFRTMKVYATGNFMPLVREAENYDDRLNLGSPASTRNKTASPLRGQFVDTLIKHTLNETLDDPEETVALSSPRTKDTVREVCRQLLLAKGIISHEINSIKTSQAASASQSSGFFGFFKSFLDNEEDQSNIDLNKNLSDLTKTEFHLVTAFNRLESLFGDGFESVVDADSIEREVRQRHMSSPASGKKVSPEVILSEDGTPVLSPEGRRQLKLRLAKPVISYEGNPDIQKTRSHEIDFLVIFLLRVSLFVNNLCGPFIEKHYSSGTLLSELLRSVVSPPVSYVKIEKGEDINQPAVRRNERLPPRINLRFLANKMILLSLLLGYLFLRLFGMGFISQTFYACLLLLTKVVISFSISKLKSFTSS